MDPNAINYRPRYNVPANNTCRYPDGSDGGSGGGGGTGGNDKSPGPLGDENSGGTNDGTDPRGGNGTGSKVNDRVDERNYK